MLLLSVFVTLVSAIWDIVVCASRCEALMGRSLEAPSLDAGRLGPVARMAIRASGVLMLLIACAGPIVSSMSVQGLFVAGGLVFALYGTAQILHDLMASAARAMARAKDARRSAINAAIARLANDRPGQLATLLAARRELDAVPDWPLAVPTLARFGLLAVATGLSWFAQAVVERLIP